MDDPTMLTTSEDLRVLAVYCGMKGTWICSPSMVLNNAGCCLKIKPNLKTKRKIYCTDAFQTSHPDLMQLLRALSGPTLKLLASLSEFAQQKDLAIKRNCPAETICLLVDSERSIFSEVKHCFSIDEFRDFVFRLDLEASCPGI